MGFYSGLHISPTAQTVIDRMTDINIQQKNAINDLVNTFVGIGFWNNIVEIQSYGGLGSEANGIIGWKGFSNAINNSATWANTGFDTNGTTSYINTQVNASDWSNVDSCGFGICIGDSLTFTGTKAAFGDVSRNRLYRSGTGGGSKKWQINTSGNEDVGNNNTIPAGLIIIERSSSTTSAYYEGRTLIQTSPDTSVAAISSDWYIGGQNNADTMTAPEALSKVRMFISYNGNIDQNKLNDSVDRYFNMLGI